MSVNVLLYATICEHTTSYNQGISSLRRRSLMAIENQNNEKNNKKIDEFKACRAESDPKGLKIHTAICNNGLTKQNHRL